MRCIYTRTFFFRITLRNLLIKNFHTREIPRSGSKAQDREEKKKKKERLNDGNNNGQATHGARNYAWRTQTDWAKINQFSTGAACKPPGPKSKLCLIQCKLFL